jgi:hypothetical protein
MKIVKILTIMMMVWMTSLSWAVCPGQGADVEFVNGVDVKKEDAKASTTRLKKVVTEHPEVNSSCVDFNTSYNTNEPYFIDFLEAGLQKAEELSGDSNDFWKQYFRTVPALDWFNNLVVETLFVPINGAIGLGEYALGDQTLEHLAKYAEHTAPATVGGQRKRLILVGHSQGSAVAVLERKALSVSDQANTFVVSASAFTVPEPEHDRYTTLDKDNLASTVFATWGAPIPNVPLESTTNCDNTNTKWLCHAFKETYLNIPESRNKIADDIVAFLPTQSLPSLVLYNALSDLSGSAGEDFYYSGNDFSPTTSGIVASLVVPVACATGTGGLIRFALYTNDLSEILSYTDYVDVSDMTGSYYCDNRGDVSRRVNKTFNFLTPAFIVAGTHYRLKPDADPVTTFYLYWWHLAPAWYFSGEVTGRL